VKLDLNTLDAAGLERFMESIGEPAYRGRQVFRWLHARGVREFDQMTDLPASLRAELGDRALVNGIREAGRSRSRDGTVKTLYRLESGAAVEAVLIPDFDPEGEPRRMTACVSSQVGCAMNCSFCATGRMGFTQNLTSGEIFEQVFETDALARSEHGRALSNIVFMGMGEPLLNYEAVRDAVLKICDPNGLAMSPRRITISTVGLAGQIRRFADEDIGCNLAVSLHAPTDEKRSAIMPVNRRAKTDLVALRDAIVHYGRRTGRRVTYEYCLFRDFNDTDEDAAELARIAAWTPSKVNLIMYNPVEGVTLKRTGKERMHRFIQSLVSRGVLVTVRRSRGRDIEAACGQLAVREARSGHPVP
jgi:23S rRNA (adenine2503-C2)-methyltransferase